MSDRPKPLPTRLPASVPCPPPSRQPFIRLAYPRDGQALSFLIVGQHVYGILSHWWDGSPIPCRGAEGSCPGCIAGWEPRWYGYLAALELPLKRRRIAVLTEGAYRNCERLQQLDGQLRGQALRLSRMGKGRNAPVKAQMLYVRDEQELPEEWPVHDTLCRLWGLKPGAFESIVLDQATAARLLGESDTPPAS